MRLLIAVLILLSVTANAAIHSAYPMGCKPVNFHFAKDKMIINVGTSRLKQHLFLLRNKSNTSVLLDHVTNRPMGAGWSSQLTPRQWSAFAVDRSNFALTCLELHPGAEIYVPCAETLAVCQMSSAVFNQQNSGTYWVSENRQLKDLISAIKQRGIRLTHG